MEQGKIGEAIAVRVLSLGEGRTVTVSIGKPAPFPGGKGYYCPIQIEGMGAGHTSHAGGEDAVQAIQLAMKKIGAFLYTSDEAKSGQLRWRSAPAPGDLGFPVPDSIRDLAPP
jgi:hypothetical protein